MRLLHAQTFELLDFFGEGGVPQYAILSHTWGSEEVTLDDMYRLNRTGGTSVKSMTGFRKIELTCQRALRDGLRYVWIDTCCIDKRSSAELSEAINSMYRWYAQANICYAYLADVPPNFETLPDLGDGQALSVKEEADLMDSEFSRSRWFARGWTLQELIAPTEVKFYNSEFGFIGSKTTLAYLISGITGIDEALLLGEQPMSTFCVARRMSWAAKRMTTRAEDIAYCLLGIFGVNMPLLYGEGIRAYIRLQEEIIKSSNDQSIFAWNDEIFNRGRTLFAPGPNCFASSGNIVPWEGEEVQESFGMSNRGLVLRLPLVETIGQDGETKRRGVLGCRYEDDFTGPIALNLDRMTRSGGYPLAHSGPKLSVVPLADVASATYTSVAILEKFDPRAVLERAPPIQMNRKCWIKILGDKGGFEIVDAYPSRFWNQKTGIFTPPRGSRIIGGAHFLSSDGMEFVLALGYAREGALPSTTRFYQEWIALIMPEEGRSLEQMTIRSSIENQSNLRFQIELEGLRRLKIQAAITTEKVMDETVFVVSLGIASIL